MESKKKSYKLNYLPNRKRLTDLEKELMVFGEAGQGDWGAGGNGWGPDS